MSLTLPTDLLRRISAAITPAAQAQADEQPTAFTETMRVDFMGDTVRLYCTDGFRLHSVEIPLDLSTTGNRIVSATAYEPMVFGVEHLHQVLENYDADRITLEATFEHSWWTTKIGDVEGKYQVPVWPDVDKLLNEASSSVDAASVGFNVRYFTDFVEAAAGWANFDEDSRGEEDDTFPLEVLQLRSKGACSFQLPNSVGLFRVLLMPVVLRW
jgi:hypothetical protein